MIALFKWMERLLPADCGDLGAGRVVTRVAGGRSVPAGCVGLVADAAGSARRVLAGQRLEAASHELLWCFHPGPYRMEIAPFGLAPEMGLHLQVVVDDADPRLRQQRFDLFVLAEAADGLGATELKALLEAQIAAALEQGALELPPCTTLDEWHAFRAGLNQLVYTRFGLTVEDCFPVDLGERVDYAAMLAARPVGSASAADAEAHADGTATALPTGAAAPARPPDTSARPEPSCEMAGPAHGEYVPAPARLVGLRDAAHGDALALRRLFLELPQVMCGLRAAALPDCADAFRLQKSLLARLDLVLLAVSTMPALELEAPGRTLARDEQQRRATASARATAALDEAWSLLARIALAGRIDEPLADGADRIVANLEAAVAQRRATRAPEEQGEDA